MESLYCESRINKSNRLLRKYCDHYIPSLESKNIINKLSESIIEQNWNQKINSEIIVTIPAYVKEENLWLTIDALIKQEFNFVVIIFINWDSNNSSEWEIEEKTNEIQKIISSKNSQNKFFVVSNLYNKQQNLWEIRSDMINSIALSLWKEISDPIICSFDADTYKISKWYIKWIRNIFDNNENLSYVAWQLRYSQFENEPTSWLSEVLHRLIKSSYIIKNITSLWWKTSFRLLDFIRVKWYDKNMSIGEDVDLGRKFVELKQSYDAWNNFWWKIFVSPRRTNKTITEWWLFIDQWDKKHNKEGFQHVNESEITFSQDIEVINNGLKKIEQGLEISDKELAFIENFINRHCERFEDDIYINNIIRFWNMTFQKSLFKLTKNKFRIKLEYFPNFKWKNDKFMQPDKAGTSQDVWIWDIISQTQNRLIANKK